MLTKSIQSLTTWNVQVDSATVSTRDWKWNKKEANRWLLRLPDTSYTYSLIFSLIQATRSWQRIINESMVNEFAIPIGLGIRVHLRKKEAKHPFPNLRKLMPQSWRLSYNSAEWLYARWLPMDLLFAMKNILSLENGLSRRGKWPDGRTFTWEKMHNQFVPIKLATDHGFAPVRNSSAFTK